jgi:hypothetical protein
MLKACARLLPPTCQTRRKWGTRIFQEACSAGHAGDMVLSRCREALPLDAYRHVMEGHSRRDLPTAWTRNLPLVEKERKQRLSRNNNNYNARSNSRKRAEV